MAEEDPKAAAAVGEEEDESTPGYKAPAQKSLEEIQNLDQDDESLVKYKQTLLANTDASGADEGGLNVLVKSITLVADDREDVTLDLTGDITNLKSKPFVIKEGSSYRLKITFRVQREIVVGLKYHNVTSRKGIRVDKITHMLGSYGPKSEAQTFLTPPDDAPSGMLARGSYVVKSKFLDDDKNVYLAWDFAIEIKKDWA